MTLPADSSSSSSSSVKSFSRKREMLRYESTSPFMKWIERFCVSPVPYYAGYLVVGLFFYGMLVHDEYWYLLWIVFSLVPLLDLLLPVDLSYPENDKDPSMYSIAYKLPLWGMAIVGSAGIYFSCARITSVQEPQLSWLKYLQMTFACALATGGIGITVAHELVHKPNWFDRFVGNYILALTSYMHFTHEHVHGHHVRVATPEDPASAAQGQSFYAFYPQTVIGSWMSSWEMERLRLQQEGKQVWSVFHNKMIQNLVMPFILAVGLGIWFNSIRAFGFFYFQAWMGFSLLEIVNYVEHYGLRRQRNPDGTYEPVKPTHSWNSPHTVSNYLLFKLQRHSDHHAYALRPYQILRNFVDSPHLPTGYAGMIVLALFPPLYFRIMDKRIVEAKKLEEAIAKRSGDDDGEHVVTRSSIISTHLKVTWEERITLLTLAILPSALLFL